MRIIHSAITSPIFELVKTIEFDIQFEDDYIPTRIEILRDTERTDFFRCRIWELELFNLTPTFPMDENGVPLHISSDSIQVERSSNYHCFKKLEHQGFVAANVDTALQMILDDVKSLLEWVTSEEAKSESS